jgi:Restriction endonuclease
VIEQVKAYKPMHLVTANDVRALIGVLAGHGASKGCLSTTSDFAPMIKRCLTPPLKARSSGEKQDAYSG